MSDIHIQVLIIGFIIFGCGMEFWFLLIQFINWSLS